MSLPLSSNDEAKNFFFPRQVACIKDHAEFILGKKKGSSGVSKTSELTCYNRPHSQALEPHLHDRLCFFMCIFLTVRSEIQL